MERLTSTGARGGWVHLPLLMACACSSTTMPVVSELAPPPDHPPGLPPALDPQYPESHDGAFVGLARTPVGTREAQAVVARFFEGVVAEQWAQLAPLFHPDATATLIGSRSRTREPSWSWSQRFAQFDYQQLQRQLVYRPAAVQFYPSDLLPKDLPPAVMLPPPRSDELVVVVPLVTPRIDHRRLLGEHLYFVLRPDHGRYLIRRTFEPFDL